MTTTQMTNLSASLYTNGSNESVRKMRKCLIENNIEFYEQNMKNDSLSWEQLLEILMYTDDGIVSILAVRSNIYLELVEQGLDFDSLTLSQFHDLVVEHPTLIKTPIVVAKGKTFIGYRPEDLQMLESRKKRMKRYQEVLLIAHANGVNEGNELAYI